MHSLWRSTDAGLTSWRALTQPATDFASVPYSRGESSADESVFEDAYHA